MGSMELPVQCRGTPGSALEHSVDPSIIPEYIEGMGA